MPDGQSGVPAGVELDFTVHWCARHLEPFREGWPDGAAVGMVRLFEAAVADSRIIDAAPKDSEGRAQATALNAVLREYSPLCCLVGDDRMKLIYREVDLVKKAHRLRDAVKLAITCLEQMVDADEERGILTKIRREGERQGVPLDQTYDAVVALIEALKEEIA